MENKKLTLSVDELAEELGICRSAAYALVKRPGFPSIRISKCRIIIVRSKLIEWLETNVGNMVNGENT